MRVILIAHTKVVENIPGYIPHDRSVCDADDLTEQGGRLCHLSWNRPNPFTANNSGYLKNILKQGHYSVMEHASATFYIDGVTRNFTHELIRHRHHGFSEVSQRFVDALDIQFVEHPGLTCISKEGREKLKAAIKAGNEAYDSIVVDLTHQGKERKEARQAARHSLVSGMETKILVTGNMRAWREMLSKRLSPSADEEFRQVSRLILEKLKSIAPNTFQDFV